MSIATTSELAQFRDFLSAKLAGGEASVTPEEALDEFRIEHPTPAELEESLAAIRESMAEIESGSSGTLASDYFAEVRALIRKNS